MICCNFEKHRKSSASILNYALMDKLPVGMDEKELTRLEMATLLFVNDRHHSQLSDLMPEKSGMTGHGKDLFEPTLKDVADYKAPTFEPGGGLQQGTYVPKGRGGEI